MRGYGPDHEEKTVVIPLRWVAGAWKPLYGGGMPKLKEGTFAEMTLAESAFEDVEEVQRFNIEEKEVIIRKGNTLWAALSPTYGAGQPSEGIPADAVTRPEDGLERQCLKSFTIIEDLKLHLRGTKFAQLENCRCELGKPLEERDVLSINQAYTRLSEHYEPKRKSHTGNVFDKVFYRDGDLLLPLETLRMDAVAKLEKRLFHQSGELPLKQ